MCGIVGVAGNISKGTREAFRFMLLVDQIRGVHSTGVASVDKYNDVSVIKKAMNSSDFLDLKSANGVIDGADNTVMIGHNRAATKGAVNNTNAHPFIHGNITGVHNGTLRNQALLDDHKDFDVDSDNLYYHMSLNGVDDTVSKLYGAYTLVWYDEVEESLNFTRNAQRPLHYAFSEDGKELFWASEPWMIVVGCNKGNIKIGQIFELAIDTLMTFDMSGFTKWKDKITDRKTTRKVTPYVVPKATTYNRSSGYTAKKFHLTHCSESGIGYAKRIYHGRTTEGSPVTVEIFNEQKLHLNTTYSAIPYSSKWVNGVCNYEFLSRGLNMVGALGAHGQEVAKNGNDPKSQKQKQRQLNA